MKNEKSPGRRAAIPSSVDPSCCHPTAPGSNPKHNIPHIIHCIVEIWHYICYWIVKSRKMKRKRPELSPQKLTIICWKMLDGEYQLRKKEFNCKNNQVAGRVILTHTQTHTHTPTQTHTNTHPHTQTQDSSSRNQRNVKKKRQSKWLEIELKKVKRMGESIDVGLKQLQLLLLLL